MSIEKKWSKATLLCIECKDKSYILYVCFTKLNAMSVS